MLLKITVKEVIYFSKFIGTNYLNYYEGIKESSEVASDFDSTGSSTDVYI
ncbi:hypothetical protein MPR_3345 [Myroides profundi]|nr:hypothetical protein MPR_3345 [Myroides profundi]